MLEQYFRSPRVLGRLRTSPIHDQIKRLVIHLDERGHSHTVVQQYVEAVEHYTTWATAERKEVLPPDKAVVDGFIRNHLPQCQCPPPASRTVATLRAALNHLRVSCGVDAPSTAEGEPLIDAYVAHLKENRGLAAATLHYRARYAREFISCLGQDPSSALQALAPQEVMRFVMNYATKCKRSSSQVAACSLRSFLRFLHTRGLCRAGLVQAVPRIPQWKKEGIPKTLSEEELDAVRGAFDGTSATGKRDRAMTLCMTEIGLRVSEVVAIDLDDVDWRNGSIRIHSPKRRRWRVLPLTAELGSTIADYLEAGRPDTGTRRLFVRHRAPAGRPVSPALVRGVVRRAYARVGLPENTTGTHVLRHTTATRLYQRGVSLKEVADLLGHESLDTTAIYTKVDLPRLASVALPWPEEHS